MNDGEAGVETRVVFPHERLEAYGVAEQLLPLLGSIARRIPAREEHLRSQLVRAAASIALNTAEGAAETSRGDKARFYRIARRSAGEAAALLSVLQKLEIMVVPEYDACRELLHRISLILFRLIESQNRRKS